MDYLPTRNQPYVLTTQWPDPAESFATVRDFALPKAFEFFGVLTTIVLTVLIVKALRS